MLLSAAGVHLADGQQTCGAATPANTFGGVIGRTAEDSKPSLLETPNARAGSPNIIYIGEIHNKYSAIESLRIALGSRQQLVVATIHGIDVVAALERLINWAQEVDAGNACENLANSLLAIVVQDLEVDSKIQQFLFVPFKETSLGIRAKLRDKQFLSLADDIRSLRNRISTTGVKGI